MRPRSLAVLAAVVVALAAFVWFWERHQPDSAEREARGKRLVPWEQEEVTEAWIAREGREVHLVREAAPADGENAAESFAAPGWTLAEPFDAPADAMAVDDLIRSLTSLERGRSLGAVERAAYGLEPPGARVRLRSAAGDELTLDVGAAIPGTDQRAVALDGSDEVLLVAAAFASELEREPGAWRSRELFPWGRSAIERLTLRRPAAPEIVLEPDGNGGFRLAAPIADEADPEAVEALVGPLLGLTAEEFLDAAPPEATTGLDAPGAVVEVGVKGREAPWRLALGNPVVGPADAEAAIDTEAPLGEDPGAGSPEGEAPAPVARYARAAGQTVTTRAALGAPLEAPVEAWRSHALTPWASYQIDAVNVARPGAGELSLRREEGEWRRDGEVLPYGPVTDLLAILTGARADRLAERPPGGEPVLTIGISVNGGETREIAFHEPVAGEPAVAATSGREVALVMPPGFLAPLLDAVNEVRTASPAPAAPDVNGGAPAEEVP